jgi:hypothetical protein
MKARSVSAILLVANVAIFANTACAQISGTYTTRQQFAYSTRGVPLSYSNVINDDLLRLLEGPAENDPSGNWGFVDDGVQMSLRFDRQVYAMGQSITGILVIRNVSDEQRNYSTWGAPHVQFGIVVMDDQGREVNERGVTNDFQRRLNRIVNNPKPVYLRGLTQSVSTFRLDDVFELEQPGRYFARASVKVYHSEGIKRIEVGTGNAMFEILSGTKKPKATETETGSSQKVNPVVAPSQSVPPKVGNSLTSKGNSAVTPTEVATATSQSNPPSPLAAKEEASEPRQPAEEHSSPQSSGNGTRGMALWSGLGLLGLIAISWFVLRRKTAQ